MLSAWHCRPQRAPPKVRYHCDDAYIQEEEPARGRAWPQGRQAPIGDHDRRGAPRPCAEGCAGALGESFVTKTEPRGTPGRDVARWFWDLFGPTVKAAIVPAGASLAVIAITGWEFVKTSHLVPGWAVVGMTAVGGLCVTSIVIQVRRWWQRRYAHDLGIQHVGPNALWWHMGKHGDAPVMGVVGDFLIVNRLPGLVGVPRSVLLVSYRRWGFPPARRYVEGHGLSEPLGDHKGRQERLFWNVEPPILREGNTLVARVCLVLHTGHENWTQWTRWPCRR
jgi:hypothetical protein